MSLKGGLSNAEIREIIAKHAEGGELSPEKYNELIQFYSSAPTKSHPVKTVQSKKKANPLLLIGIGILIVFIIFVIKALAHPGRTDANGGHYNRSTGEYHYHTGEYADQDRSSTATSTGTYVSGYNEGKEVGHRKGYENGYEEGYKEGKEIGYEDGHKDGQREANSTFGGILAFVFIGMAVVSVFKS